MSLVPEIETERLILRAMTRDDFERYAAIWKEPEVVRFIGKEPRSLELSWTTFLKNAGAWVMEGFGHWAIAPREGGPMIGQVGFFAGWRGLGSDFDEAPECGWVLSGQAHGRGYGREAAIAAHRWFDCQVFGGKSHVMIETGHHVSLKLARSLGYISLRRATTQGGDQVELLVRDVGTGQTDQ